jgi:hypothetical protein
MRARAAHDDRRQTVRTLTRPLCYSRDHDRLVIVSSYGWSPRNSESVYHRFMGYKCALTDYDLQRFTEVDFTQLVGSCLQRGW